MDRNAVWAGVDVGYRKSRICLVDALGAPIHEQTCATNSDAIAEALSVVQRGRIAMIAVEAGSPSLVIRKLREANFPVVLFETRKASKFLALRRNKTDAGDARGLADLARLGQHTVSQVYLKSLSCEQLRSELVLRQKIVQLRVAADAALRSRLAVYGKHFVWPQNASRIRERVVAQLAELKADEGIDLEDSFLPLIDVCVSLRSYQQNLDRQFAKMASEHPVCRRLCEVTGVGPICSISFYTAIENPTRIRRTFDVGAYFGLVPRRVQSGDASYTKGITRTGSKMTRSHLVTAATIFSTRGPDSELKEWATALRERIGAKRAQIAVARKLAIILLKMWKDGSHFEPYPSRRLPGGGERICAEQEPDSDESSAAALAPLEMPEIARQVESQSA